MPFSATTHLKSSFTTYACSIEKKVNDSNKARLQWKPCFWGGSGTTTLMLALRWLSVALSVVRLELSAGTALRSRRFAADAALPSGTAFCAGSIPVEKVQSSSVLWIKSQRDDGSWPKPMAGKNTTTTERKVMERMAFGAGLWLRADVAYFESVPAPDWWHIDEKVAMQTRPEILEGIKSGKRKTVVSCSCNRWSNGLRHRSCRWRRSNYNVLHRGKQLCTSTLIHSPLDSREPRRPSLPSQTQTASIDSRQSARPLDRPTGPVFSQAWLGRPECA